MSFFNGFLSLGLLILAACSVAKSIERPHIFNEQLLLSSQKLNESLSVERSVILFDGGDEARDCNSYSGLISKYPIDESVHNQMVKSEYLICDALEILSKSKGLSMASDTELGLGALLGSKLDVRSFPSSLNRSASELSFTLNSLYPGQVTHHDNIAVLETDDWSFTIEVAALAQINDNHSTDWIVWVFDESKLGNYKGYSTLILYDPDENDIFRANVFP